MDKNQKKSNKKENKSLPLIPHENIIEQQLIESRNREFFDNASNLEMELTNTARFTFVRPVKTNLENNDLMHSFSFKEKQNSYNNKIEIKEKYTKENAINKRIYRKSDQRPRPDLGPNAEENRLQKQFKLRVSPEIPELADKAAKKAGMTRSQWIEMLIRNELNIDEP